MPPGELFRWEYHTPWHFKGVRICRRCCRAPCSIAAQNWVTRSSSSSCCVRSVVLSQRYFCRGVALLMAREHRVWDEYVSQTNHAVIVVIPILVLLAHTVLGTRTLVMLVPWDSSRRGCSSCPLDMRSQMPGSYLRGRRRKLGFSIAHVGKGEHHRQLRCCACSSRTKRGVPDRLLYCLLVACRFCNHRRSARVCETVGTVFLQVLGFAERRGGRGKSAGAYGQQDTSWYVEMHAQRRWTGAEIRSEYSCRREYR